MADPERFGLYEGMDREAALRMAVCQLAGLSALTGFTDMSRQFFDPKFHAEAFSVISRWTRIDPLESTDRDIIMSEVASVREWYTVEKAQS